MDNTNVAGMSAKEMTAAIDRETEPVVGQQFETPVQQSEAPRPEMSAEQIQQLGGIVLADGAVETAARELELDERSITDRGAEVGQKSFEEEREALASEQESLAYDDAVEGNAPAGEMVNQAVVKNLRQSESGIAREARDALKGARTPFDIDKVLRTMRTEMLKNIHPIGEGN